MDARYGAPPVPPPGAYGNIPTQRLPTQIQQFDTAPSCVQNAMLTKDKKPFTYTPGGIDLSQIKSPRMAKRIARNAQIEGVSGQPKPSPLVRTNGTENGNHSPTIHMGAAAMGMPFQVFPTAPPPQPQFKNNGNIPPPPPSNLSAPVKQAANVNRISPTPQSFEPPPMGLRPEIKIPTNPMDALKKVPRPQENNDFWVEEYKKERSKSPMVERNDSPHNANNISNYPSEAPIKEEQDIKKETNGCQPQENITNGNKVLNGNSMDENNTNENKTVAAETPIQETIDEVDQGQPRVYKGSFRNTSSSPAPQTSPQVINNASTLTPPLPSTTVLQRENASPLQSPAALPSTSPKLTSSNEPSSRPNFNNIPPSSPKPGFSSVTPPVPSPTVRAQSSPKPNVIYNNVPRDMMNNGATTTYAQTQPQNGSPTQQISQQPQKNAQVGSIYIPPVPAENLAYKSTTPVPTTVPTYIQQQSQFEDINRPRQSTPLRWMATRPNTKEIPEWAKEESVTPSSLSRPQSMYRPQTNNNATPMFSTTNTYQTVQSPPPSNTGLKLQINNNIATQPRERIIPIQLEQTPTPTKTPESPKFTNYSPRNQPSPADNGPTYTTKNPNQFVDQGYNNFSPMSTNGNKTQTRIIPMMMENQSDSLYNNSARGPVSSGPVVIQNNSRGINPTTPTGNTTPNQSKSFRILQKITSTEDGNDDLVNQMNQPAELQQPHYSRQMMATPQQQTNNAALEQLQRMQINRESGKQGPPMKYPQPPTYVQQRTPYQNDNEQYIPPSQQQAPEPKIYTGSAIPSRSFKILQAMTTPENAAEMENSDVAQNLSNDNSLQSLDPSSHLPFLKTFSSRSHSFHTGDSITPNIIVTTSDDERSLYEHNYLLENGFSENSLVADVLDSYENMRSMESLYDVNDEDESEFDEIHLEVIHEDTEQHGDPSNDTVSSEEITIVDDDNDINEVTVRLPLRLSFSKSKNDDDLTVTATVEVGKSQYENKRGKTLNINSEELDSGIINGGEEEEWKEVDDFWGTSDNEELQTERQRNDKKAMTLFSKPTEEFFMNEQSTNIDTIEKLKSTSLDEVEESKNHQEWPKVDDFWGTENTEEEIERRKSNYKNAMSLFNSSRQENTKSESKANMKDDFVNEVYFREAQNTDSESDIKRMNFRKAKSFFASTIEENSVNGYNEFNTRGKRISSSIDKQSVPEEDSRIEEAREINESSCSKFKIEEEDKGTSQCWWKNTEISNYLNGTENTAKTAEEMEVTSENENMKEIGKDSAKVLIDRYGNYKGWWETDEVIINETDNETEARDSLEEKKEIENKASIITEECDKEDKNQSAGKEITSTYKCSLKEEEQLSCQKQDECTLEKKEEFNIDKARAEVTRHRSWWKSKETSVEPQSEKKRFSMFEQDSRFGIEVKMKSIKERIQMLESSFEETSISLSRNNSQRSESELDEDSGVTDMVNSSQLVSETDDTESDNFPELRKMSRYSRAATHSRLFKLLQDEIEIENNDEDKLKYSPSKRKIIHNVSITRRQNPDLFKNAETLAQRRERLSLPLGKNTSIDNDNPSTPNSPRSPISRTYSYFTPKSKEQEISSTINEQLVTELVQSLLLKKDAAKLKKLPMDKLQAAAKKALEEQLDSLECTSIESTPAMTPSKEIASEYSDYYDSWKSSFEESESNGDYEFTSAKSLRRLQEQNFTGKRKQIARCPRVTSSKTTFNRDLARVTESPEIARSSSEHERDYAYPRCHSVSRWVKIS